MNEKCDIKWVFCNSCGQKTKHFVRGEHCSIPRENSDGTSLTERMMIVECCGCEHLAFLKLSHFSEDVGFSLDDSTEEPQEIPLWEEAIYPPVSYRSRPVWFEDLPDRTLLQISEEIYKSLQSESLYLATFGSRTLLDRLMVLIVGDRGNFNRSLEALVEQGQISKQERDIIAPVVDAGHAAAHRGWVPTPQQLNTM